MSDQQQPPKPSDDVAARLRLTQMELANRMRLQNCAPSVPAKPSTPRGGFSSMQGIQQLRQVVRSQLQANGQSTSAPSANSQPSEQLGTLLSRPLPGLRPAVPVSTEIQTPPIPPPEVTVEPIKEPKPQRDIGQMFQTPFPRAVEAVTLPPSEETTETALQAAPSGVMPSLRNMPNMMSPPISKEAAKLEDSPKPIEPKFDPARGNVIGATTMGKAPLPAIYHATVRHAEQTGTPDLTKGSVLEAGQRLATKDNVLKVPKGSEVNSKPTDPTSKPPSKLSRMKRFKNPKLKD